MQEFERHLDVDKMLVNDRPISISEMAIFRRNLKVKNGELIYKRNGLSYQESMKKSMFLDILVAEIFQTIDHETQLDFLCFLVGSKCLDHS